MDDPRQTGSYWVTAFVCGVLALAMSAQAAACTKRLRWHDDPPYTMRLPDGRVGGWSVELTEAVLKRMGCEVQLKEMPFARALTELKAGRLDMLDGVFPLTERRAYAHFSAPTLRSRNLAYIRATDRPRFRAESLAQLARDGWTLGGQVGVVYSPAYAALKQDPELRTQLHLVPRRTSLWPMLVRGRIDVVIADEASARHELVAANLQTEIVATPLVVSAEPASMAFSKATTDLAFVQRYDATVRAMQIDGSYQRLQQRYGIGVVEETPAQP